MVIISYIIVIFLLIIFMGLAIFSLFKKKKDFLKLEALHTQKDQNSNE